MYSFTDFTVRLKYVYKLTFFMRKEYRNDLFARCFCI